MRAALCLWLLSCVVGCSKANRPSKGLAAREVGCRKSGVERSEPIETTWTGEDGVLHVRYRVGIGCSKPKSSDVVATDLWQECAWVNERWRCGAWQSGPVSGGPREDAPATIYLDSTQRGFIDQ
ncbi:MAG: hypothetical protein ACE37F_23750 [Nannocystaceae bacterium]|nr:hypothetical protein [bacterium]